MGMAPLSGTLGAGNTEDAEAKVSEHDLLNQLVQEDKQRRLPTIIEVYNEVVGQEAQHGHLELGAVLAHLDPSKAPPKKRSRWDDLEDDEHFAFDFEQIQTDIDKEARKPSMSKDDQQEQSEQVGASSTRARRKFKQRKTKQALKLLDCTLATTGILANYDSVAATLRGKLQVADLDLEAVLGVKMMIANQALQAGVEVPPDLGQTIARMQNLLDDDLTTEDASSSGSAEPGRQCSAWRGDSSWDWHGYYSASSSSWQQGW